MVTAAHDGDPAARAELVEACLPRIGAVARMYRHRSIERLDLMQAGVVGVLGALERFDPTLEVPFWAYAAWWVRQAMQQLVSELGGPVVLSDRAQRELACVRDARRTHLRVQLREPSSVELAGMTGLALERVDRLLLAERVSRGLDEPVTRGEGPDGATIGDSVSDPRAEDAYDRVLTRLVADDLRLLIDGLDVRERDIVKAHYGLGGPARTLREIAGGLGISAERVRQIEHRALDGLRLAQAV